MITGRIHCSFHGNANSELPRYITGCSCRTLADAPRPGYTPPVPDESLMCSRFLPARDSQMTEELVLHAWLPTRIIRSNHVIRWAQRYWKFGSPVAQESYGSGTRVGWSRRMSISLP